MRVNIVVGSADANWIAGRLARELVARLPQHGIAARINVPEDADVEFHQIVYGVPNSRPAIGMFTHGEFRPRNYGPSYDGQIALNSVMAGYLRLSGCDPVVIDLPVDDCFCRRTPMVFGVAGRTYADGRKGEHLVRHMVEAGYRVVGWGSGWPCEILSDRLEDLPSFYEGLDYYVDTSSDEGGCTPALECMALGIPVISHTLGVDRPVLAYETHDWPSLQRVLQALTRPHTYAQWAQEYADYFRKVVR